MATRTQTILNEIISSGTNGCTAPELTRSLKFPPGTTTSRTSTLLKKGLVASNGKRNKSRVYVAASEKKITNNFILVMDHSGSMTDNCVYANNFLEGHLQSLISSKNWLKSTVSIENFNTNAVMDYKSYKPEDVLIKYPYVCAGGTDIVNAVNFAINYGERDLPRDEVTVVFVVTDGFHNSGCHYPSDYTKLANRIEEKTKTGLWTFVFLCPFGSKNPLKDIGVPEGNIHEYANFSDGVARAIVSTNNFLRGEKTSGGAVRQSKNYFQANLSSAMLQFDSLREITTEVRTWQVERERDIEAFLNEKVKSGYRVGTGFYEVMKRESKIAESKKLVIHDPASGRSWTDGKISVRKLCSFPEHGDISVKPGNHAGFVLMAQSKSSAAATFRARLLPRGTRVLLWEGAV
jgi:hypothetical protein